MGGRALLEEIWAEIHDFAESQKSRSKLKIKSTIYFADFADHSFRRYHHLDGRLALAVGLRSPRADLQNLI
jgi:hypothetical protein